MDALRLIFSKDRAAQLDLLLRSLRRFAPHESTRILWAASEDVFVEGYLDPHGRLPLDNSWTSGNDFDLDLRRALWECPDTVVTFLCDDDVVVAKVPLFAGLGENVLTHSLRLGKHNPGWPGNVVWDWTDLPRTDFGFPGSIDGHTFRVKDVLWMIENDEIVSPTMLETVLALMCEGLATERPLMSCHEQQCLVGVPVNRVSDQSGVPFGEKFPQTTKELNDRWLGGERVSLDAVVSDLAGVDACHKEIEFRWEAR